MTLRCFRGSVQKKKKKQTKSPRAVTVSQMAPLKAVDENNTDLASTYRSRGDSMQNTIWMLGPFCSKRSPAALLDEVFKEPVGMAGQCLETRMIPEDQFRSERCHHDLNSPAFHRDQGWTEPEVRSEPQHPPVQITQSQCLQGSKAHTVKMVSTGRSKICPKSSPSLCYVSRPLPSACWCDALPNTLPESNNFQFKETRANLYLVFLTKLSRSRSQHAAKGFRDVYNSLVSVDRT